MSNKRGEELDEEDQEDNIEKIAIEGNLSPKQIDTLKASHGKQKKKRKNPSYRCNANKELYL